MDDGLDTPNCPNCLTRMEIAGTEEAPFWRCADCGKSPGFAAIP